MSLQRRHMSTNTSVHVSLEQAKLLVEYIETDQQDKADELIAEIQSPINTALFAEIGKLTRQLHDSLNNFHLDSRLNDLATAEILSSVAPKKQQIKPWMPLKRFFLSLIAFSNKLVQLNRCGIN